MADSDSTWGLGGNTVVAGGFVLVIVQSLSRLLEQTAGYIFTYLFRLIFVTIDVDNTQDAYAWLTSYLSHLHTQNRITTWGTLSVLNDITTAKEQRNSWRNNDEPVSAKSKGNIYFIPGTGIHFLRLGWFRWVLIHKTVAETQGRSEGTTKEVLWMGTIATNEGFFRDLIETARVHAFSHDNDSTVIFVQDGYRTSWKKALSKTRRSWQSVILDGTLAEEIFEDCTKFLQSRDWYTSLGVPYRRSYLLESPPGCGKSSFIQALAGRLNFDIAFLSLSASDFTDQDLSDQLRSVPPDSVVVLEELDAAFPDRTRIDREQRKKAKQRSLTMGGLLNALDGLVAAEGRLCIFTTNHLEQLDPALLRPGRVDRIISLKLASANQIERLFLRFFPGLESVARLYARGIPQYELSMAQVQGHLLRFRQKPVDAVSDIPAFLSEVRAAAKRRADYEKKLLAVIEKKEKSDKSDDSVDEDAKPEEKVEEVVDLPVIDKGKEEVEDEEGDDYLSNSVASVDVTSLEKQVAATENLPSKSVRRRRKKKIDLTKTK